MTQEIVSVQIEFHWQFIGHVQLDMHNQLKFPFLPRQPGIYRFRFSGNGVTQHYVGETDELQRRFQNFRTPGYSQKTNIRMNANIIYHLKAGGTLKVDTVVDKGNITVAGNGVSINFSNKAIRRLLEQAALVAEIAAGTELLNR